MRSSSLRPPRVREYGPLAVAPDGMIVRDIVASYSEGAPVLDLGGGH